MTICPPKDTNTALYHDLVKAGNGTLTEKQKSSLGESAFKIFMETPHLNYVRDMLAISNLKNIDSVLHGFQSPPNSYKHKNAFETRMWNRNGSITTPWYGDDYAEKYYKSDRDFLMVLELPDDIKDQVGGGQLLVNLEGDLKEEEEVSIYTLHTERKNWTEAEAECQRHGGHLASVRSKEENEMIFAIAGSFTFIGGRKESGIWSWSWTDNSSWVYENWHESNSECAMTYYGLLWQTTSCGQHKYQFVCKRKELSAKNNESTKLHYERNQLTFTSFHVWYRYKAVSQQPLKNKRMTGIKLNWRFENENPPLLAHISEMGRSLEMPKLGAAFVKPVERIYKVVLALEKDLAILKDNESLTIELEGPEEPDTVFWDFKLSKKNLWWKKARKACENDGGQLASIHSTWEQELAEQAAEKQPVWLGGWIKSFGGEWHWTDNSSWRFTNWKEGIPVFGVGQLMMYSNGDWASGTSRTDRRYSLCQGKTPKFTERGLSVSSVELNKEQLKFFPLYVLFEAPILSQEISNTSEPRKSGFTLSWFIKDSKGNQLTEKLPSRPEDWKTDLPSPKFKEVWLVRMVQIAQQLRMQNMTREEILDKVMREKSIAIYLDKDMCIRDQVKPKHMDRIFSKLMPSENVKEEEKPTVEDIETGFEVFSAMVYCPVSILKLYRFIEELLSKESSRTIIQSMVNLFQSRVLKDELIFTVAKEFYLVLASTLELQYGNVLLATSTKSQIQTVIDDDLPFFTNNTEVVKTCMNYLDCDGTRRILQQTGC